MVRLKDTVKSEIQDEIAKVGTIQKSRAWLLLAINFIFLIVVLINYMAVVRVTSNWPEVISTMLIVWCAVYVVMVVNIYKTIYLFSNGFILALLLFHISHLMLHYFGVYDFSKVFYDPAMGVWYYRAGWMILVALSSFAIGMSFSATQYKIKANQNGDLKENERQGKNICWWYGLGLLMVSAVMMAWVFYSVGNIFAFSRRELFSGVGDTRGFGLFQMFFPSAVVLLVIGAHTFRQKLFSRLLAVFGLLFILFLGYRSVALFPMLIGFIVWVKLGRKLNKKLMAVTILFLVVAIPAVKTIRSLGSYDSITVSDISESIDQASADEIFLELGAISGIIAYTLKWVPEEEDYRYGKTYYLAIINSIPNIGLDIRESNRQKIEGDVDEDIVSDLSAADWFIYRYNKWMYETGGGSGYSIIAEPYLNFGITGVVLFFVLLGYILGRIEVKNLINSPLMLLFCSSMMWPFLKLVRNDITTLIKPMVFLTIVLVGWKIVTFWKKYKRPLEPLKE